MSVLPRLLVVTEWEPGAVGGGPAILRQMLQGYPAELLSWWSCFPVENKNARYYSGGLPGRLYPNQRLVEVKARLLEAWWVPRARRNLAHVIQKLAPEVIWHVPHKWAIPVAQTVLLPEARRLHVTVQDYMNMTANFPLLGRERAQAFARIADDLYCSAQTRDATSHPMIEDLLRRTGATAEQMIHAGLEEEDFNYLQEAPTTTSPELRLAYAGTIQVEAAFLHFLQALKAIKQSLSREVRLIFFSAHRYADRDWFDPSWMEEKGHLGLSELHRELRSCSWGISLMALNDDARYNRYSFPTKFISYLAGGLPILTVAHPESSVYQMAANYKVGISVSTTSKDELKEVLREALGDLDSKKRFRAGILRCAQTEFDAQKMRNVLYDCFRRCAQAGRGIN